MIVPVGECPVTVAVHVEAVHETAVVVEPTVIESADAVPELPMLFVSPE